MLEQVIIMAGGFVKYTGHISEELANNELFMEHVAKSNQKLVLKYDDLTETSGAALIKLQQYAKDGGSVFELVSEEVKGTARSWNRQKEMSGECPSPVTYDHREDGIFIPDVVGGDNHYEDEEGYWYDAYARIATVPLKYWDDRKATEGWFDCVCYYDALSFFDKQGRFYILESEYPSQYYQFFMPDWEPRYNQEVLPVRLNVPGKSNLQKFSTAMASRAQYDPSSELFDLMEGNPVPKAKVETTRLPMEKIEKFSQATDLRTTEQFLESLERVFKSTGTTMASQKLDFLKINVSNTLNDALVQFVKSATDNDQEVSWKSVKEHFLMINEDGTRMERLETNFIQIRQHPEEGILPFNLRFKQTAGQINVNLVNSWLGGTSSAIKSYSLYASALRHDLWDKVKQYSGLTTQKLREAYSSDAFMQKVHDIAHTKGIYLGTKAINGPGESKKFLRGTKRKNNQRLAAAGTEGIAALSDTEQRQKETDMKNRNCFKCHKPGHQARDCPNDKKAKKVKGQAARRKVAALGKAGKGEPRDAKTLQSELTKSQQLNAKQQQVLSVVKEHLPEELRNSGNVEAPLKAQKGAKTKRGMSKEAVAAFMETVPGN